MSDVISPPSDEDLVDAFDVVDVRTDDVFGPYFSREAADEKLDTLTHLGHEKSDLSVVELRYDVR